jgi:hypothetical protein
MFYSAEITAGQITGLTVHYHISSNLVNAA